MKKKTPERIEQAKALYSEGKTHAEIASVFGISQTTVRQWIDPEYYATHTRRALDWQKRNSELINTRQSIRARTASPEQRQKRNEQQRLRYTQSPTYRATLRRLQDKYGLTAQGTLARTVRQLSHGHADRHSPIHTAFMTAATGMARTEYTERFKGDGVFDHIIPLCAFDLTNPDHLLRALHPTNLRLVPAAVNMEKGKKIPADLDIMALPWIRTEDALTQAQTFISMRLAKLERRQRLRTSL